MTGMSIRTVLSGGAVLLALAACGGDMSGSSSPQEGQVITESPPTSAATTSVPPAAKPPAAPAARVGMCPKNPPANGPLTDQGEQVGKIGSSSYTYKSLDDDEKAGLCVAVLKVERVTFSQYSSGAEDSGRRGVAVTIQVVNNDRQRVDLTGASVDVKAGPAGTSLESVYDADGGFEGGFTGGVTPGKRATARYAFALPAKTGAELTIEVTPGWDFSGPAVFEGHV